SLTNAKPEVQDGPIKKRADAKEYAITLHGKDLFYVEEVVKSGENTSDFSFKDIVVSKDGSVVTLHVTVPANKAAGFYKFKLKYEDGQTSVESFIIEISAEDHAKLFAPTNRNVFQAGISLAGESSLIADNRIMRHN